MKNDTDLGNGTALSRALGSRLDAGARLLWLACVLVGVCLRCPTAVVAITATPTTDVRTPFVSHTPTASFTVTPPATATPTPYPAGPTATARPCVGDCNRSGVVTVDELVTGVAIVLGSRDPETCVAFNDPEIAQLVQAVGNALGTCLPPPPLPDLAFDQGPYVNAVECSFERCAAACIVNVGNAAAAAFDVLFARSEDQDIRSQLPGLAAGEGQCLETCTSLPFLSYTGTAIVDPDGVIEESREDNNAPTFSFPTPTPSISCP